MVSLDLKDAYFSVPIFQPHWLQIFAFYWEGPEISVYLSSLWLKFASNGFFNKNFKSIIAQLRLHGLRIVIFLDAILHIAISFDECMKQISLFLKLPKSLGIVINGAKSQLEPITRICFLGFIIDSISMKLLLRLKVNCRKFATIVSCEFNWLYHADLSLK